MRSYSQNIDNKREIKTSESTLTLGSASSDLKTLKRLLPYLRQYWVRIALALTLLIAAKLSTFAVPIALKQVIDALNINITDPQAIQQGLVVVPLGLLIAYGSLRLFSTLFQELRNAVFAKAGQASTRAISLNIFEHMHKLSLRFHLDRQTGGLSNDIARGSQSISALYRWLLFSLVPTMFEVLVVCGYLFYKFGYLFAAITIATIALFTIYTYYITQWRTKFRLRMIEADSVANTSAIDSLLNYETVKYFSNEKHEYQRYDNSVYKWQQESIKSELSLSLLNAGQGLIIGTGTTLLLILAANRVISGEFTIGDWAMVSAFMMQLFIPLNFLGTLFREIKRALIDISKMFNLLYEKQEITEPQQPQTLRDSQHSSFKPNVDFNNVEFSYNTDRQILKGVNFTVPAGQKVAIVGSSGAGKSTLTRLLFRFYDVTSGSICINGTDIRNVSLEELRQTIGVVPQDTVLFNDTLFYNIQYGKPTASKEEVLKAIKMANLDRFVSQLPDGLQTTVGERGLKLSGGEKQRVAIARTILKNPDILILDEATSSLDSQTEKEIQDALNTISKNRTTLVIAHRLSTIIDADNIIVLDSGKVLESGTHAELLKLEGTYYTLWTNQQDDQTH
ncbi:MAG: ABCB family ABC transporter ATP-binding protein/permease [Arenicella sp.]